MDLGGIKLGGGRKVVPTAQRFVLIIPDLEREDPQMKEKKKGPSCERA